jgi:cobalt/nickel transport system permease protein
VVACAWSLVVVLLNGETASALALGSAVTVVFASGMPWRSVLRRLTAVNAFMALLWVVLPFSTPGPAAFHALGRPGTWTGLGDAALITLKGNAIVLALTALIGTVETATLGHALRALRVPAKLTLILLLSVRYVPVLRRELDHLRRAMRVRCFRARFDLHTGRSLGFLVGMLLVRAFIRAERVLAAMRCRGFSGEFPAVDLPRPSLGDAVFAAGSLGVAALLLGVDRLWTAR